MRSISKSGTRQLARADAFGNNLTKMCSGSKAGSYLRLIRLKDFLGPVTRVKKKKKK